MIKIKGTKLVKRNNDELYNNGKDNFIEESESEVYEFSRGDSVSLSPEKEINKYDDNLTIKTKDPKTSERDKKELYNNGKDKYEVEGSKLKVYDFSRGESVEPNYTIIKEHPKSYENNIIKSNIDGGVPYTNVQDENSDSLKGFLGTLAGEATNQLGITNSQISNLADTINGLNPNAKQSSFDENMAKLNDWKKEKYKELHPFDWKPGQTIPKDLMNGSIASVTKEVVNTFGSNSVKAGFKKAENFISPDPVNYARNSIKASKGLYSNSYIDQGVFTTKTDNISTGYASSDSSSTVVSIWNKNDKEFSSFNKSPEELKFFNALKNKNTFNKTLGYIYIKPNYNYDGPINNKKPDGTGQFQIPFEFNPEISEGPNQANYVSETLLNRIGQFHIYTGTNLSQLSISLEYVALAPDELDDEQKENLGKQYSTDSWQYYWTNNRIEEIEYKLRSLVFPDVVSADYLIKPPLIELHLGNELGSGSEDVGDLYKYPIGISDSNSSDDKKYLSVTRSVNKEGTINRYKKYIVTNIQIEALNKDSFIWPSLYGRVWQNGYSGSPINHIKTGKELGLEGGSGYSGYTRRTGFKATLQCLEVTENFLDIVPDFKAYYDAWKTKNTFANYTSNYASNILNESIEETTDFLNSSINTLIIENNSVENILDYYFKKAYTTTKVYDYMNDNGKKLNKYNYSLKEQSIRNNNYYYVNSKWPWNIGSNSLMFSPMQKNNITLKSIPSISDSSNDILSVQEKENFKVDEDGPVIFNIKLDSAITGFINKWKDEKDKIKNIYLDKADLNLNIAGPLNPLSANLHKNIFYGKNINSEEDVLKLYTKDNEVENGYMPYIYNSSNTETEYTDIEAFFAEKRLVEISNRINKKASEIEIIDEENTSNEIDEMFGKIISASIKGKKNSIGEWENDKIDLDNNQKIINILKEQDEEVCNILFTTNRYERASVLKDSNSFAFWDAEFLQSKAISLLSKEGIASENIGKVLNFIDKNHLLPKAYRDFRNKTTELKDTFYKFKELLRSINASYKTIDFLCDNMELRYKVFINNLNKGKKYCLNIVYLHETFNESVKDIGQYLANSLLVGTVVKCINSAKENVPFEFYTSFAENYTTNNKPEKVNKSKNEETIRYFTYMNSKEIKILNARNIEEAIINSSEKVQKEIEDLHKELNRIGFDNLDKLFEDINSISFKKFNKIVAENFSESVEKNSKIFLENYQFNINKQISLIEKIMNLKKELNEEKIQKLFSKIVGNYQGSNNNAEIKGLNSLKSNYKEYSKNEKMLREKVFSKWDKLESFDSSDELVVNGGFKKKFEADSNGKIPNAYFKKYSLNESIKGMQVAGNDIKNYNKLTSNDK